MTDLKTFAFDIHRDLPIIATAFVAGELQYQKLDDLVATCSYAGPCGLGVCIPAADRAWFDQADAVEVQDDEGRMCVVGEVASSTLFDYKLFTAPDIDQIVAFNSIQEEHDYLTTNGANQNYDLDGKNQRFRRKLQIIASDFSIDLSAILGASTIVTPMPTPISLVVGYGGTYG